MMGIKREAIDEAVREYATEKRHSRGVHPEVEELTAYHEGELDAESAEKIRDHLALCGECVRLVLDLENFAELEPPSEAYRLSAQDAAETKQAIKKRIGDEKHPPANLLEFAPRSETETTSDSSGRSIPTWYHALVAALLAVTVGLGFWVAALQQTGLGLEGRSPELKSLFPSGSALRGRSDEAVVRLDPEKVLVLRLEWLGDTTYPQHRIEILGQSERKLWDQSVERKDDGGFVFFFPRELQTPGSYTIRLLGVPAGPPVLIAEYSLQVRER